MTTMFNRTLRAALALGALAFANAAWADAQITGCHDVAAADGQKPTVQCDLRATEDVTVKSVKVTGNGQSIDATYTANNTADPPASVLILLDRSGRRDFERMRRVAGQLVGSDLKGVSFGAYGFTRDMQPIAPMGTAPATIRLALESVGSQSGASELLRNIVDALPLLTATPGKRKILLVFSNGDFQDTAYTVGEVSAKLKQANVVFVGVAPGNSADDIALAQSLRRMAQDTSGEFLTVQQGGPKKLKDYLAFGGVISFEPIAADMKIEADVGKPVSAAYKTTLPVVAAAASPGSPADTKSEPPKPLDYTSPREIYNAFLTWLRESVRNQIIFAGGAVAVILVLLLVVRLASRRRPVPQQPDLSPLPHVDAAPSSAAEIKPVIGWLEFLDGNQTREPIRSRATRIGRYSDNDIVLKNTSVHRQHAVIREDQGGGLVIVDMDTTNGVYVNGERVKSAKLKQGDVIELGEVRMRFSQPHAN